MWFLYTDCRAASRSQFRDASENIRGVNHANQVPAESVGPNYDRGQMCVARRLTFDAINEIVRQIAPA